jgi:hypothetical protein
VYPDFTHEQLLRRDRFGDRDNRDNREPRSPFHDSVSMKKSRPGPTTGVKLHPNLWQATTTAIPSPLHITFRKKISLKPTDSPFLVEINQPQTCIPPVHPAISQLRAPPFPASGLTDNRRSRSRGSAERQGEIDSQFMASINYHLKFSVFDSNCNSLLSL